MGMSRNELIIGISNSVRLASETWDVPGSTASCEFGNPAGVSPKTPPPRSRNISTACSGRTRSESPRIIRVGDLILRMFSAGRSRVWRSISVFSQTIWRSLLGEARSACIRRARQTRASFQVSCFPVLPSAQDGCHSWCK